MLFGDRGGDSRCAISGVGADLLAFGFDDDDGLLGAVGFHGKGDTRARLQCGLKLLHGAFDIVSVVVLASYDDEVFGSSGDVKFALMQEAQISGAEEWSVV